MRLHTGNGPNSIIVGKSGKSGNTMLGKVGGGPKSIIVGMKKGPKLIMLQKFGNGPKTITVGIGGSTTIIEGIFIGPSGPISKQGKTIGGGCIFISGKFGFEMSIVGMSGIFGISISNGTLTS